VSGFIPAVDRHQTVLLPETLEDYVGAENPVRVIDAFVDGLALDALGFARTTPAETGRPGYDPHALLKLYLYGYLHRVRSSRRLERETHCNVEVMWLVRRLTPDHKTISDFRAAHAAAMPNVFRAFTIVCRQLDLFGAELVGIDGTKLRAVNAKARSHTPAELRRLLRRIDARVRAYVAELDAQDRVETGAAAAGPEPLRAKLAQLTARQAEYQAMLGTMTASGATQVTLTDPESRRMKTGSGIQVCYNAQIAVDAKHHLIVAEAVTNAETDLHQLSPMAEAAHDALGAPAGLTAVADAGYHNGPEVVACLAAGIVPEVPAPTPPRRAADGAGFAKAEFTYQPEGDAYRCPAGQVLPFRFATREDGQAQRYYYDAAACRGCPLRARCTGSADPAQGRRIKRWGEEAVLEAMAARVRADPLGRVRRKSLVEHPFGTIKRWDDAGYLLVRGLTKVRAEFSLMALAYNVRRVINVIGVPRLLAALGAPLPRPADAVPR
jgi:transposase